MVKNRGVINEIRGELDPVKVFIALVIAITIIILAYPYLIYGPPPETSEWAYEITQINELHDLGLFGANVTIGIVDTGIDLSHPELEEVNLILWKDLINNETEPYDERNIYHGTAVVGIIAGKSLGVAPEADLIMVKAVEEDGSAEDDKIIEAVEYCIDNDADIISLSLGGRELRVRDLVKPWMESEMEKVCERAAEAGILIIAAAGNDGGLGDDGEVAVPSVHDNSISVGAIDYKPKIADFSSSGDNDGWMPNLFINWDPWEREDPNKKPELVAPGVDIEVPIPDGGYDKHSGTSLAVPFVTGALALILGDLPILQHEYNNGSEDIIKLKKEVMKTSKKIANQDTPHDDRYGYGLLQAYDLYKNLEEVVEG